MPSDFVQALFVTILGMGLVFIALGVLMLIVVGLQWVLRERPRVQAAAAVQAAPQIAPSTGEQAVGVDAATSAAIGVALAIWKARHTQAQLPPPKTTVVTFAPGSDAWRALGRLS